MKMNFRKLLKLLNNDTYYAKNGNLFWKVYMVKETERKI